jgi:predicted kinase
MELSGPGAFSRRSGPPMMRREPSAPRQDRPPREPREPRQPSEPREPRGEQDRGDRGGRGGERGGRGRGRRRRGRRRDNAAAPAGEAVVPTPAVTDQSLAAALPGLAAAVPVEDEAGVEPGTEGAAPAPDFAPELKPAAVPQLEKKPRGVVVLAIGLPGSGKSTWFKRRGVTPLSSDMLRTILFDNITEQRYQHLVFSTLRSLLRARLIARMPWNYVDATNLSPKERRHWIHMARGFGYETHAVFFDVPVEVCMERNQKRERVVLEEVMQRMAAKLRPPKFEEGFAKITVVRVKRAQSAEAAEPGAAPAEGEPAEPVEGEEEVEE